MDSEYFRGVSHRPDVQEGVLDVCLHDPSGLRVCVLLLVFWAWQHVWALLHVIEY